MGKIIFMPQPFELRPYTKKELLTIYKRLSPYILNRWLDAISDKLGEPIGQTYSVKQVQIIIDHYGLPGQYVDLAA